MQQLVGHHHATLTSSSRHQSRARRLAGVLENACGEHQGDDPAQREGGVEVGRVLTALVTGQGDPQRDDHRQRPERVAGADERYPLAEQRRANAIAKEQEMKANVAENRAEVLLAQASGWRNATIGQAGHVAIGVAPGRTLRISYVCLQGGRSFLNFGGESMDGRPVSDESIPIRVHARRLPLM